MKAQLLSVSILLTCISIICTPAIAGKKDFALYFEQASNGVTTIRVRATYYVKKGDADSKKAAQLSTQFWNKKSGEFNICISNKNNYFNYILNFDLLVMEVEDPAAEMRKDKTNAKNAITIDGSSNSFTVVNDTQLGKSVGKTFGNNAVEIRLNMRYDPQVGPHEVGHTLLIEHAGAFSRSVMADDIAGSNLVLERDVSQIIVAAFNTPALHRITIYGLPNFPLSKSAMTINCKTIKKASRKHLVDLAILDQ